jgi:AraC-like DNA-binding protein
VVGAGDLRWAGRESRVISPTISIRYIVRLLELAERDGANAAELLAGAGLDPIVEDQPDVRVATDRYYRLWAVTMAALGDPSFPMRLAGIMDTASFDALGFAVITSATYGDALERIQRYLPFVTDGASWAIERGARSATLTFTQHGEPTAAHRHVDAFSLAHLVIVGRRLTATPWQLDEVRFRHAEPDDTRALAEFFAAPLRFDAATTSLHLPAHVLDLPLAKANPSMAAFFDRHIESVLARTHPEHGFVTSVRRLMAESLVRHACSLEALARQLAMSPRTLRRRLGEQGVTYSALLDQVRRDLAAQHLRDRRLSVGEIAFALGYSEPATFHRAFRRWTGVTPAAYRAGHRADCKDLTDR